MTTTKSGGVAVGVACAVALALTVAGAGGSAAAKPLAGKSVIGGYVASISAWPYQAALTRNGKLHCGGSVIAPTKILTAAHCVNKFAPRLLTVITGRARLADPSTGEALAVESAAMHPDYPSSRRHDVAVITLAGPTSAPAVRLPTPEQAALASKPGRQVRVAGFGARHPLGGKISPVLMEGFARVRRGGLCRKAYRRQFLARAMICAKGSRVWKYRKAPIHQSACFGDSGGPLVTDRFGPAVEIGVVSYGSRVCGYSKTPAVYARVSDALDFINLQLAN
jgi:secreted trypsin-like serine protease